MMATKVKVLQFLVIIPVSKFVVPPGVDNNPFHRNELLTAFIHIHVVLTSHYLVFTGVWTDGHRRDQLNASSPSGSGIVITGGLQDRWDDQPDDAVSCSHDVEAIDDSSSTDVGEITLLIRAQLKRNLMGEMTQQMPIRLDVISNVLEMFSAEHENHSYLPAISICWVQHFGLQPPSHCPHYRWGLVYHQWALREYINVQTAFKTDTTALEQRRIWSRWAYRCRTGKPQAKSCLGHCCGTLTVSLYLYWQETGRPSSLWQQITEQ